MDEGARDPWRMFNAALVESLTGEIREEGKNKD
jgi:hypothetical protein